MIKALVTWALTCATALPVCAQEVIATDTVRDTITHKTLDEVVIKASATADRPDRKLIYPDRNMLRTSADGLDLLRKLQLAHITVNPLTDHVSTSGNGMVKLLVNGIEATPAQIAAIRPSDVIRVEYHDNPGIRHTEAAAVINYITIRHNTGGHLLLDSFGAYAKGRRATIGHLSGQINKSRAVWTIRTGTMSQHKNRWTRDYDEIWYRPDATITRHEDGMPVTVGGTGVESLISCNYLLPTGNVLDIRATLGLNEEPNREEGDRRSVLHISEAEKTVLVREHTGERSVRPGLGAYYLLKLGDGKSITIDGQTSYMYSRIRHEYTEDNIGETSRTDGKKYAAKLSCIFEKRAGDRLWSIGLQNSGSIIENTYRQETSATARANQTETTMAGEYSDRLGHWDIMTNARLTYKHLGQAGRNIDRVFFMPSLSLTYRPADKWSLRYTASLDHIMPTAAQTADVAQPIQTGMTRRGNPHLQPFRTISQTATASFSDRHVGIETKIAYRNEHTPIMESVIWENSEFVRTYFNQRSFQQLEIRASAVIHPWVNHLSITVGPALTRYFSHGVDYRHCHNIFRMALGFDFNYGHWLAYGNIMSGPANRMYGEEIIEEKDMNQIMAGYKRGMLTLHLGVFNAFVKNYWMKTRNLSALAPYTSKAHSGRNSSYIALKINIALDFGSKSREVLPHAADTDNDPDILTTTK